jgi:hypothetical protein
MSKGEKKSLLEIVQSSSTIFATIALPIILAIFTAQQNTAANNLKYVEVAINVLQSKPTEAQAGLREWAISVLDKHAAVPLTEKAKVSLRSEPAPFTHHLGANAVATTKASAGLSVVTPAEQKR